MAKEHLPNEIPEDAEFEVVGLQAENIKALRAVRLVLKGKSLIVVGGNNAQGKTSLLDCIPIALGGKKYEPEEVIRRGESHGRIVLDLDEVGSKYDPSEIPPLGDSPIGLKITVVFTKKAGRKLILEAKDGFPFRSPQEIFDRFVTKLTFDPLEFVRMEKEKQVEIVRKMAGIDFTQLDTEHDILYEQRRDLNRDLKNAEAVAGKMGLIQDTLVTVATDMDGKTVHYPESIKPVDIPSLIAQRDQVVAENRKNDERLAKINQLKKDIQTKNIIKNDIIEQIQELQLKLEGIEKELTKMDGQYADWSTRAASLVWVKTDEIDNQIAQAQEVNALVEKKRLRDEQLSSIASIRANVEGIESQMEGIKDQKARMLTQAKYPVSGFKIDPDGGLLYNDLPFSQASGMQQIDVAIDMALAINPRLKLALVREGSIIDLDNLKRIWKRVEAKGGKLIMERTGKGPEMSVIIQDGTIIQNNMGD